MVFQCCVKGCETIAKSGLHSFPSNKSTAEKWIRAIKSEDDFTQNGKGQVIIKAGSVPSLFLPIEDHNDNNVAEYAPVDSTSTYSGEMKQFDVENANIVNIGTFTSNNLNGDDLIDYDPPVDFTNTAGMNNEADTFTPNVGHVEYLVQYHPSVEHINSDVVNDFNDSTVDLLRTFTENNDYDMFEYAPGEPLPPDEVNNLYNETAESVEIGSIRSIDHGVGDNIDVIDSGLVDSVRCIEANRAKRFKTPKNLNELRRSLNYYKKRVADLTKELKLNKMNDANVLAYLSKKFNQELFEFVKMQLHNCGRSRHGRRYTDQQKSLCLALYKQGPRSYRFKEKWCALPTKRTLGRYSADLVLKSGIDSKMFLTLKNIVENWSPQEKMCAVTWDEVSLKEHLDYNHQLDYIEGFVTNEIPKEPIFATHSLTFMVRGIASPYKQGIGYFYTNGLKSFELTELVKLMIERVSITGLDPVLSVCDQASTNANTINSLIYPNSQSTTIPQTGALLKYKVNGRNMIHCFDPSHLIKSVRNNLETKDLRHFIGDRWEKGLSTDSFFGKEQTASWNHIEDLYKKHSLSPESDLLKLTQEHIKPNKDKMRVSVAAQVFSNTTGKCMAKFIEKGILPPDFNDTTKMLYFMNDLFDSINGCEKDKRNALLGAVTSNSHHFEFWEYALSMLPKMHFVDKVTNERNNRSSVLKKFESTIRGYREVSKICFNSNIEKVDLRYTTQDGLENFFGSVKAFNQNIKVTPRLYRTGYTTTIINNISSSSSLQSNCQPDESKSILSNVHDFISELKKQANITSESETFADGNELIEFDPDQECVSQSNNDLSAMIAFDPGEVSDDEAIVELVEAESVSKAAIKVCQKLFRLTKCLECKLHFELTDKDAAILSIEKILFSLRKIIPYVCFERFLKRVLLGHIKSDHVDIFGCVEHNDGIQMKTKCIAVEYVILTFCNGVNKFFSNKTKILPKVSNRIEKLAFEHQAKHRGIGKHSDINNQD